MKGNELKTPLVKSAIVLVAVILLFAFAASSPGSLWSQIGGMITGILTTFQLGVALLVAVFFSIAVLIGIFFGAVAMFSRTSAENMFQDFRVKLAEMFPFLESTLLPANGRIPEKSNAPILEDIESLLSPKIESMENSIAKLGRSIKAAKRENTETSLALKTMRDELREISSSGEKFQEEQEALNAASKELTQNLDELKTSLDSGLTSLEPRTTALEAEAKDTSRLDKLSANIDALSKSLAEMQAAQEAFGDVEELKQSISVADDARKDIRSELAKNAENTATALAEFEQQLIALQQQQISEDEQPRIFNYIEDTADQEKFAKAVLEAVDADMTQAQVMEFVIEDLPEELGKIVADHPSLSKDYIRTCKKTS